MNTINGITFPEALDICEEKIGYKFKDRDLLQFALTHASGASSRIESNERLEFLGDAILSMVVCNDLYHRMPQALEGELTKVKSAVVSRRSCAKLSEELGLGDVIVLGKGMTGNGTLPTSLLAAVFESLIAAVYLDSDFKTVNNFILRLIRPLMDDMINSRVQHNFKSLLQQYAQRKMDQTPVYEILDEKGPDHSKCFEVCVRLGERRYPSAWGTSKKEAEQSAACKALETLGLVEEEPGDETE